jgi:hypothetical protein
LDRCHERAGPEDLHHPLHIVSQDVEADLGFHILQPPHQEVRIAHPGFDRAEGVFDDPPAGAHDLTPWIEWFLGCLDRAFDGAEVILASVLKKARFWDAHAGEKLNDRQRAVIKRLLNGFEGKLTSSKYASLTKSSQDTASRDIDDLVKRGILVKDAGGGRSTSYSLADVK